MLRTDRFFSAGYGSANVHAIRENVFSTFLIQVIGVVLGASAASAFGFGPSPFALRLSNPNVALDATRASTRFAPFDAICSFVSSRVFALGLHRDKHLYL